MVSDGIFHGRDTPCTCVGYARWELNGVPISWPLKFDEGARFINGRRGPPGGICGGCGNRIPTNDPDNPWRDDLSHLYFTEA